MKTLSRFVSKFTRLIVAVLSCFDRVIFKGVSVSKVGGKSLRGYPESEVAPSRQDCVGCCFRFRH